MVSGKSVETACLEVGRFTDDNMVGEFDRFFRAQPAICEFIIELTSGSGHKIQELSLFLAYIVFKALEIEQPGSATPITHEALESAYRHTESWLARIGEAGNTELQSAISASLGEDTQPFLLQYIISELNEPVEDGDELNDEEKGEVFFILKTIIGSIDQGPKRSIIEIHQ